MQSGTGGGNNTGNAINEVTKPATLTITPVGSSSTTTTTTTSGSGPVIQMVANSPIPELKRMRSQVSVRGHEQPDTTESLDWFHEKKFSEKIIFIYFHFRSSHSNVSQFTNTGIESDAISSFCSGSWATRYHMLLMTEIWIDFTKKMFLFLKRFWVKYFGFSDGSAGDTKILVLEFFTKYGS